MARGTQRDLHRCWWASGSAYHAYHDDEWGRPTADDRRLFEKISLEGFQSGLSWLTILNKREHFRKAFADFDMDRVARFNRRSVDRLLQDAGIVRHRGKIESVINNARRAMELRREIGSIAAFVWQFEPLAASRPAVMTRAALMTLAQTPESMALSRALKTRGWTYVGPTTIYAFMQACGLVNDHVEGCQARTVCATARQAFVVPRPRPGGGHGTARR